MATTVTNNTKELSQSQQQGVSSSSAMVEDEFIKRNTDCVYFLASPLTCKKGSECEYRHSEYARVNPRDCWYWLNANCLNPKCSFRHPPLDGLVGPQTGNLAGPSTLVPLAPPVPAAPQNPTKEGVPCIFFQKGYCLKGDRCPFMHGSNPASIKAQQPVSVGTATPEAPAIKKTFGTMEKCTQAKGHINVNAPKVVEPQVQAKAVSKVQSARPTNGHPVGRTYQPPNVVIEEQAPNYKYSTDNGNLKSRTGRTHHGGSYDDSIFQNGRDADDSLRESSPGFDVLVDDKLSEDEYHHNEDQYVSMRGHEGRNTRNFDLVHQEDYNIVPDIEPKLYQNRRGYDSFDRLPEKYAWDHPRASTERSLVEPAQYNRRGSYTKSQSPDYNQNSDLRQRLSSKQGRRVNGLKSAVNPDYDVDAHAEDRGYRSTRRDPHRSPTRGHRLQGRIKLPRRSSPSNGNDVYSERKNERGGDWERSSSTRQQVSVQQGRIQDRLSGRNIEESHVGRRINAPVMRKDTSSANGLDFAGPKSLSELRGTKQSDSRPSQVRSQQSAAGGKLRDTILASSVGTDVDISFEGPKPLSEILKRKRAGPTDDALSESNKQENKQHKNDVKLASNVLNTVKDTEKQVAMPVEEVNKIVAFEADEEGEILNKKIKLNGEGESYLPDDDDNKNSEVGDVEVIADAKNQEFDEEYDHGDGEYEYEQEDGEGYNLNEIETGEHEVDRDEDDEDEFAKMLGVSF